MSRSRLLIPVYLNQRLVFDLLAMMQDGLSRVTKLTTTEGGKESTDTGVKATFGLPQALASLLKIDLSARAGATAEQSGSVAKSEERIHTPASLLFKLRDMMVAEELVQSDVETYLPKIGDLVEFSTTLHRNPLIEAMDTMLSIVEMYTAFIDPPNPGPKGRTTGPDMRKLKPKMELFRDKLKAGGTVDIVSETLSCASTAVITLEEEFLSDPTMADLVDGHFTVLGKIVRVIGNSEETISLVRKAALGALSGGFLPEMFASLETAAKEGAFRIPELQAEIRGPAFQVLPIGIYA